MNNKNNLPRAKQIQYKQWLAANPEIAKTQVESLRAIEKPKRNAPCPCGSKLKYKKCCG